jgi:TolA-binding protein
MGEKKQLNVRIPLELQEKIENDGRPKVEIVIEALELYFASKAKQDDSNNDISANNSASQNDSNISKIEQKDSNEVLRMKTEIEFLRAKIDDLLKLLHQEQVLHIQTQRMLTAPQPDQKKWWQFWS